MKTAREKIPVFVLVAVLLASGSALAVQVADDWHYLNGTTHTPSYLLNWGRGATAGMVQGRDNYLAGDAGYATVSNSLRLYGGVAQVLPLKAWQGRRLNVSLRLKNEGDARAWVMANLRQADRGGFTLAPQRNAPGSGEWQSRNFVLDVPANATDLTLTVGLTGKGRIWIDTVTLEPAGADMALTEKLRSWNAPAPYTSSGYGLEGFGYYPDGGYSPPSASLVTQAPGAPKY